MSTYEKIVEILKQNKVEFKEFKHDPVRTSEEAFNVRQEIGIELSQGAKALLTECKTKNKEYYYLMVVVPGDKRFDTKKIKKIFNLKDLRFIPEDVVLKVTNGVQPGGVPPFGNIFDLQMVVDESLKDHEEIAFNAGDKEITIVMDREDWEKVATPEFHAIT